MVSGKFFHPAVATKLSHHDAKACGVGFIFTALTLSCIREDVQSLREYLMHERDDNRSFAHSRCHSLNVASANIADGEHSRQTRLK